MLPRASFHPFLVTALLSGALSAATPPPSPPFDSVAPTLRAKPIAHLLMGQFVIFLEVTGLRNVRNIIGVGPMSFKGDGAEATSWVCYTLDSSLPHQRLWIMSNAEMGGSERLVDGVTARFEDRAAATPECPSLPKRFQPVSFDHGVWLGETQSSIRLAFGSPSKVVGQWREYYYSGKTRDDGKCTPDGYDVVSGFAIKVEHDRITQINASQVTSC